MVPLIALGVWLMALVLWLPLEYCYFALWFHTISSPLMLGYNAFFSSRDSARVTDKNYHKQQRAESLPNENPVCFPYREFRHCAGETYTK